MATLSDYNLLDEPVRECPFAYFKAIREEQPVYYMPEIGAYYVSRYQDVRFVKKHPQIFSNDIFTTGSRSGGGRNIAEEYRNEHGWARVSTLQRTDPPVHTCYRGLIDTAFSVKRVRTMTAYIETIVNDLIDNFVESGRCDFVSQFAVPLPCTVIADQLGVPRARIPDLKRWSDAMLAPGGGFVDDDQAQTCGEAVVEAQHFFADVMQARRAEPKDDIITDLVQAEIRLPEDSAPRALTMPELQDLLDQLLTGGNETTTSALGSAMWTLLQHPDQRQKLSTHPELMRNFVEESLRVETPVLHLWRVATEDTHIGDMPIPKGASIALGYASANRDAEVFDNAEAFDIERKRPGAHLAFGSGPHHCPGAALARQEMFSAFTICLERLPELALQNEAAPNHVPSIFLRGLEALPITFSPGKKDRYLPGASIY